MGTQPPPQKGADPQFSAHVYCGQTAGWIKMSLGTEVNVASGDVVLDGVTAPHFRFMSIVAKRLDGWRRHLVRKYRSRPRPRRHCIRQGPSSPRKGHSCSPLFGPCLLWPRLPISATAELLLYTSAQSIWPKQPTQIYFNKCYTAQKIIQ